MLFVSAFVLLLSVLLLLLLLSLIDVAFITFDLMSCVWCLVVFFLSLFFAHNAFPSCLDTCVVSHIPTFL